MKRGCDDGHWHAHTRGLSMGPSRSLLERLFNAKILFNTYVFRYIWFGLLGFYGITTIVGYLMPNPLYTYILNIYDLVWLGFLWHNNHCRLFNVKSSLYIYIKYIWFSLVGFYGITTIVGYLMSNPLYTSISSLWTHLVNYILKQTRALFCKQLNWFQVLLYSNHNLTSVILFAHCSIWPIDRNLSGATTPGQSGPGSNGNEGVLHIPQSSKARASPLDGLML